VLGSEARPSSSSPGAEEVRVAHRQKHEPRHLARADPARTSEALVAAFFTHLDAVVLALHSADVSHATTPEVRRLIAVMYEIDVGLDNVVAAVASGSGAS
jgi:hypothetical protein